MGGCVLGVWGCFVEVWWLGEWRGEGRKEVWEEVVVRVIIVVVVWWGRIGWWCWRRVRGCW